MSYGKLYPLGDAAHIVPPVSVKGMNLALHDSRCGPFRREIARARLERLFVSSTANRLYSEFAAGAN
jgi:hypothetical protein